MSSIPVFEGPISRYYELNEKVGRGAFSIVYRAKELLAPKRIVALKIVDFNVFTSEMERARQQRILEGEIEILQAIETKLGGHRNLARVFGIVRDMDSLRVGIAMEFLSGGELFDRIVKKSKYTEYDAAILIHSVMLGLKALHQLGIVHCDLKPENLIFASESEVADVKITDFGLSKMMGKEDRHAGALVGTAQYVAPECLIRREYSSSCDVWSMGVVLYILLCGYPPFYGKNNTETFSAIRRAKFEFHIKYWRTISESARKLITNMLNPDPLLRYTVKQVLEDPWIQNYVHSAANEDLMEETTLAPEYLDNLRKFNARRKFRAAAMAVMIGARFGLKRRLVDLVENSPVNNFNLDQLTRLRDSFKKYSLQDGRIDKKGFGKALSELGFSGIPVEQLFRLFDTGGEGSISYRAFLTHLSTLKNNDEESIRFCFDIYDKNGDGCLSKEEVSSVLRNLFSADPQYMYLGDETEREETIKNQIEDIFARLDSDGNGTIDYEEFKAGITNEVILIQNFIKPIQDLN